MLLPDMTMFLSERYKKQGRAYSWRAVNGACACMSRMFIAGMGIKYINVYFYCLKK
jgi:hypothetical protein